jgi:hypothetical protein
MFMNTECDQSFSKADIKQQSSGRPVSFTALLMPLSPTGKPVSQPKLNNRKSIMLLIAGDTKHSFRNLIADLNIQHDTNSSDGMLNFSKENYML